MKKLILCTVPLMIMSIGIYGEELTESLEKAQTVFEVSDTKERVQQPIKIRSVRNILGEYDLMEHTKGQLRAGYITFSENEASRTSAYALGGYYHFDTKRWNGLMIGAEAYTVLNIGINQTPLKVNPDFFDLEGKSFILLSQAYLDGKWGNTQIKLGRQALDTPHADGDDIRMMPNYFEAYTITNTDIDDLTLSAGMIDKMAGWENGINSPHFVDVGKTLGVDAKIDGIYYLSAVYEGIKDLSLSLWSYRYSDIADVIYGEAAYSYTLPKNTILTLGLQYDGSRQTGNALLGKQEANSYGVSLEAEFADLGVTVLAAYNRDNGETGATELNLGGGPFFTSMEDQTLDAIGESGKAWMIGAGYNFEKIDVNGLVFGVAYGSFEADDSSAYKSREIDAVLEYSLNEELSVTAAFASVDFKVNGMEDFDQFRLIAVYNF